MPERDDVAHFLTRSPFLPPPPTAGPVADRVPLTRRVEEIIKAQQEANNRLLHAVTHLGGRLGVAPPPPMTGAAEGRTTIAKEANLSDLLLALVSQVHGTHTLLDLLDGIAAEV